VGWRDPEGLGKVTTRSRFNTMLRANLSVALVSFDSTNADESGDHQEPVRLKHKFRKRYGPRPGGGAVPSTPSELRNGRATAEVFRSTPGRVGCHRTSGAWDRLTGTKRSGGARPPAASAPKAAASSAAKSEQSCGAPSRRLITQSPHAISRMRQVSQSISIGSPVCASSHSTSAYPLSCRAGSSARTFAHTCSRQPFR
jgi:hypothetical protein